MVSESARAYSHPCPVCGDPVVYTRMLGNLAATVTVRNRDVKCTRCASMFILDTKIESGEAQPVETQVIPLAGGDSGGVGALLLD